MWERLADMILIDDKCVRLRACQHIFHKSCIDAWVERSLTCPCCRQPLQNGSGYVCKQLKVDIKVRKLPTRKDFRKALKLFEKTNEDTILYVT